MMVSLRRLIEQRVPGMRRWARHPVAKRWRRLRRPAILGTLRRTTPLSLHWGADRGTPLDRYYIERFLSDHRAAIQGHVLEVKDPGYTRRFGTGVTRSDVLDLDPANPQATLVSDLTAADAIPDETFDCFLLTQTLQLIYEVRAAIHHAHRILKPGGVLLATVPVASQVIDLPGLDDFWRFTPASCAALFGERFGAEGITIQPYGNVLAGVAFLMGMAHEELSAEELDAFDPRFPLLVGIRAVKAGGRADGNPA